MSEISARTMPGQARRSPADDPPESAATTAGGRRARRRRQRRFELFIWLFLAPTIVLYGLYTLYPIAASYWYSMLDWTGFDAHGTYVGFSNYSAVLHDRYFWNSFKVTLLFTLVTVPVRVGLALVTAVLLNNRFMPLRRLLRTAFFLPVITTSAVVGIVMQMILDPSSGPLNLSMEKLGLLHHGVDYLGSSSNSLWAVMGVYIWKWFGITLIYWLAALQTVPNDLVEAAKVDGASGARVFWHVTVPVLKPFLVIITLLTLVDTLQVFDLVLSMTNGGPQFHTEVLEIYIYRFAFAATIPQLGYASAAAVLFGLFAAAITAIQVVGIRLSRRSARAGS
jgi:multiple sugar transport system permease protein